MTQTPAGWYPDPSPQNVDGAGLRYWDGTGWTEQISHPGVAQAPAYPPQAPAYPQQFPAYPQQPAGAPYYGPQVPSTPDGQPLAGWWTRVLAVILDGFFQLPVVVLAVLPVVISQWDDIKAWFDLHTVDGQFDYHTGDKLPAAFDVTTGPGITFLACTFLASALYTLVFLGWKQATPGKLAVGLRVRLRATPGLPWSAIFARWGVVTGLGILSQLPAVGFLFVLLILLDYLWPLWDQNKQALHDKVAGTNVVKKA